MAFKSQDNIRSAAFSNGTKTNGGNLSVNVDYTSDNLFTGVWRLDQSNLNKFDPFIGGYAAIIWTQLPAFWEKADVAASSSGSTMTSQFKALTERNFKSFSGLSDISLDADEMSTGFAGNTLPVATNIKKENTTFTIKHYELAGSPIREMYQYWITGIRDPETGLATYHGAIANGSCVYSMKNHTAELLYVVTDASFAVGGATGIEFACYYTNVFPTKIPQDHLNYSSGDHAITEIDQEFRGNYHQSSEINKLAVSAMESYKITKTYGDYDAFTKETGKIQTGYKESGGIV